MNFGKELEGLPKNDATYDLEESIYNYFPPEREKASAFIPGSICILIVCFILYFFYVIFGKLGVNLS